MGDEEIAVKKEAAVLNDESMTALAKELGSDGLKIAMYLNIPTTTLVSFWLAGGEKEESDENLAKQALVYWKKIRASAKDRDKVNDLERALREAGKQDAADAVVDRHRDNLELSADCFPAP